MVVSLHFSILWNPAVDSSFFNYLGWAAIFHQPSAWRKRKGLRLVIKYFLSWCNLQGN